MAQYEGICPEYEVNSLNAKDPSTSFNGSLRCDGVSCFWLYDTRGIRATFNVLLDHKWTEYNALSRTIANYNQRAWETLGLGFYESTGTVY